MKSLDPENDLRFLKGFLEIKEALKVKLKMISVYHHFLLYQTPKNA
jgi:hypothetical protein